MAEFAGNIDKIYTGLTWAVGSVRLGTQLLPIFRIISPDTGEELNFLMTKQGLEELKNALEAITAATEGTVPQ